MSDTSGKPERSWRDIVAEAARALRENNLERVADLRRELHCNEGVRAEATSDNNIPPTQNCMIYPPELPRGFNR